MTSHPGRPLKGMLKNGPRSNFQKSSSLPLGMSAWTPGTGKSRMYVHQGTGSFPPTLGTPADKGEDREEEVGTRQGGKAVLSAPRSALEAVTRGQSPFPHHPPASGKPRTWLVGCSTSEVSSQEGHRHLWGDSGGAPSLCSVRERAPPELETQESF